LQLVFAEKSFRSMLTPLIKIVKNENSESTGLMPVLLAYEYLHSDIGNNIIEDLQCSRSSKTTSEICYAMSIAEITAEEREANLINK